MDFKNLSDPMGNLGGKLPDYSYFNPSAKNHGIGNDGNFGARELFHFLYRLYKEIADNLK